MKNNCDIYDNYVVIYLKKRDGRKFKAIIDLEDFQRVEEYNLKWSAKWRKSTQSYYAQSSQYLGTFDNKPKYKNIYLHRLILDFPNGFIDHLNHNTLDCRKNNLCVTNNKNNLINRHGANRNTTTGVRNVSYSFLTQKYKVQLQINGKNTIMGSFDNLKEAEKCAKENRKKYYKEKYEYSN